MSLAAVTLVHFNKKNQENPVVFTISLNDNEEEEKERNNERKSQNVEENSSFGTSSVEENCSEENLETTCGIVTQIFIPFIIAVIGYVVAGIILDKVQTWEVFENVSELFILVPAIMGLKGDVEMTLASRLSTKSNLGAMKSWKKALSMIYGNIVLAQGQACFVGFMAGVFACVISYMGETTSFTIDKAVIVVASSVITTNCVNLVLGTLLSLLIFVSAKYRINPDNIATPLAASLGDITTLGCLVVVAHQLYRRSDRILPGSVATGVQLLLGFLWVFLAFRNKYSRPVLFTSILPIIVAMIIASGGGWILERSIQEYEEMAVFSPVMAGAAGNLMSVQSSRISTYLHKWGQKKTFPPESPRVIPWPWTPFIGTDLNAKVSRILLSMAIPGHVAALVAIYFLTETGANIIRVPFVTAYLIGVLLQVIILLYITHIMVYGIWKFGGNPDNIAIPILTAFGDLFGPAVMAILLLLLHHMGFVNEKIDDFGTNVNSTLLN